MKKILLCLVLTVCLSVSVLAAADLSDIVIDDYNATPDVSVSGYPRFETLKDGTLILTNSGVVRKSTDNGTSWTRTPITQNCAATATSASGKTHELSRENWQGFVLDDGTVMVAYRARTKNYSSGEFYTSIRFMTSTDNATTFDNEVIVAEATANSFNGYWEPFMIQPDEDTVLIFYSDDLNVKNSSNQQNIVYHEYNLKTKEIGDAVIAIDGESRNSRDGMPVITSLRYGGYAMVIETHDYSWRSYKGVYGKSVFVIGLSLSKDGYNWSEPVPVVAPADLRGGDRAAAPFITTLPDGRVVISYMTEDGYTGERVDTDAHLNCVYAAVISDDVITTDTKLAPTTGGAAKGFTALPDLFDDPNTGYMVWNTVFCDGEYLYFSGSAGANDKSVSSSLKLRRADVSATVVNADIDDDGNVTLFDVLRALKGIAANKLYKYDLNNDAVADIKDAIIVIKEMLD